MSYSFPFPFCCVSSKARQTSQSMNLRRLRLTFRDVPQNFIRMSFNWQQTGCTQSRYDPSKIKQFEVGELEKNWTNDSIKRMKTLFWPSTNTWNERPSLSGIMSIKVHRNISTLFISSLTAEWQKAPASRAWIVRTKLNNGDVQRTWSRVLMYKTKFWWILHAK